VSASYRAMMMTTATAMMMTTATAMMVKKIVA
jgi:hypothetical protein